MEQGFIIIHRKISENWLWLSEPFSKAHAWLDLLLMANHTEGSFFIRGVKVVVKRGVVARSEETLAERWRWSRNKVRSFIKLLEGEQQIKQHKSNVLNTIEIINYDLYQKLNSKKDNKKTTEGQQKDTNNEQLINDNNVNEEITDEQRFELFWNLYDKKKSRPDAEKKFKAALKKDSFENIMTGLEKYIKARGLDSQFWKHPSTWLNQECWKDEHPTAGSIATPKDSFAGSINQQIGQDLVASVTEKPDHVQVALHSATACDKWMKIPQVTRDQIAQQVRAKFNKEPKLKF